MQKQSVWVLWIGSVVAMLFGGGWIGGSLAQFEPQARHLVGRGMVAALVDYRVRKRHGTTPMDCVADGKAAIMEMFGEVGTTLTSIKHHYASFNWVFSGSDLVVCEGTSHGEHRDGRWVTDQPPWGAGRFCDVFEIRDWLIHRVFIYLDPDYACQDVARYPWLAGRDAG